MASLGSIKVELDPSPLITITDNLSLLSKQCATSFKDILEGLQRVGKVLTNLGITIFTPEGEYRNIGEVLEEAYNNVEKNKNSLLRPETSIKTEFSNQEQSFNFLEQNAYDHINPIFYPDIEHIISLDNI